MGLFEAVFLAVDGGAVLTDDELDEKANIIELIANG